MTQEDQRPDFRCPGVEVARGDWESATWSAHPAVCDKGFVHAISVSGSFYKSK